MCVFVQIILEHFFPVKTYVFVNESKTWFEAQAYCRQQYTDLANVLTQSDNGMVTNVIPDETTAFVGLYRSTWKWWSDGTIHSIDHWAHGRPLSRTGDCAVSLIDAANVGKLTEYSCALNVPFMCYGRKLFSH